MTIIQKPCANSSGKRTKPITHIVLHLMDGTLTGTDSWFANPAAKASAHYGIGKDGTIHQYVPDDEIAWHAGRVLRPTAVLPEGMNPNWYSIGIEHEGRALDHYPLEQMVASARLVRELCRKYQIPVTPANVLLHREIYAAKTCPGTLDRDLLLRMVKHEEPNQE